MAVLKNRAKMSTSATGTGSPITLGSAEDGYQTFADAGVANADVVRYVIEDGNNWEIGTGTYTATGTTLSRTVSESSNSDAAINLSGSATVFIGATSEDIPALYAENYDGTSNPPSATGTNAVAIGRANATGADAMALGLGATATNTSSVALGLSRSGGTHATSMNTVTSSSSYGALGNNSIAGQYIAKASGTRAIAFGNESQATNTNSIAIGNSTLASGSGALALGNDAHATDTNAVAIGKSARASQNQAVAIGENCTASGITAAVYGSINATASGQQAVVLGQGTASATNAMALNATATGVAGLAMNAGNAAGERSVAIGLQCLASGYGKFAFGSGRFAANGDAQGGQSILRADTTDATATVLTTNNSTASTDNQIVAASDTCITFDGTITAMQNGAQAYASWKIEGLLVNDGGTTTLANSATTVISNADGWGMALSADNTNNALAITCTGEASHNIRWVANIRTTEVTYA